MTGAVGLGIVLLIRSLNYGGIGMQLTILANGLARAAVSDTEPTMSGSPTC